jgi:hypothetical protein
VKLKDKLIEASKAGEIITIVYHGGSQPGTKRDISPIRVSETEVLARCLVTEKPRTFRLSKLEIVSEDYPSKNYDPKAESRSADLVVQQAIKLPSPSAMPEQISHAESLGIKLSENASRIEVVISILSVLIERHHIAQIVYLTDLNGKPWKPLIEPYAFQKSEEGIRLRCWVYEGEPIPDWRSDYLTEDKGWHLYLIDDIESVRDTDKSFVPRQYRRQDDVTLTISVSLEGIVNFDWKK